MLLTHRPATPLAGYVETLWHFDGSPTTVRRQERVLPNGRFQIILNLSTGAGAVSGLRSRSALIDPAAIPEIMGVVFLPGGARAFFRAAADAFHDDVVPLDTMWGSQASQLAGSLGEQRTVARKFQMLEAALFEILRAGDGRLALHRSVQYGLRELQRVPHIRTVTELSRCTGLSRRRFGQLFREQIGMTPKMYCRL